MTGFVRCPDASHGIKIWVPRRSPTKSTFPGMLDNTVAGGLMTGEDPFECVIREADEEASLPEHVVRHQAKHVGGVTYIYITESEAGEEGLIYPEVQWIYDLELPDDVVPQPKDGEVAEFSLCTVEEVQDGSRFFSDIIRLGGLCVASRFVRDRIERSKAVGCPLKAIPAGPSSFLDQQIDVVDSQGRRRASFLVHPLEARQENRPPQNRKYCLRRESDRRLSMADLQPRQGQHLSTNFWQDTQAFHLGRVCLSRSPGRLTLQVFFSDIMLQKVSYRATKYMYLDRARRGKQLLTFAICRGNTVSRSSGQLAKKKNKMAASNAANVPVVRISKIADRYLVFDAQDVAIIRRDHNICSVLVGTTPQNPTQNVFLSLPLELLPEEASVLVEKKVCRLVNEKSHHLSSLRSPDKAARQGYIALLKDRRHKAQKLLAEDHVKKAAAEQTRKAKGAIASPAAPEVGELLDLFSGTPVHDSRGKSRDPADVDLSLTVTPTTSCGLQMHGDGAYDPVRPPAAGPLHRHLQSKGYFMTPGLRFGADYSVYPGDPLRYHAHFLATNYAWDEKIPMLDVVGSGRLGTSVKKGFLFGGEVTSTDESLPRVRAFCVEWAGM
ncbi:putative tRNA-splicing endonuclease subunit tsp-4 [Colletotrichum tanaceti]|nr:putative tRNA-splicing endonuclease subunit tsp-4 [Colletotrichum tanaceti]KAJ0168772.1 putative tRNA-splicing endonuclease subunit tsp-4 [Colletotrichum tanaceti]